MSSTERRGVNTLVTATRSPASPAVSTLSKKTTSSGSSLTNSSSSEAARRSRMSVDDILSSSKLSLDGRAGIYINNSSKEKRETAVFPTTTMAASDDIENKSSSTPTDSSITKRGELEQGNNSASSSTGHRKRKSSNNNDQTPANNPGTDERKKRLEYMQQEKLQHQYQQQKHKQHRSSKQSLDNKNSSSSSVSSTQQMSQNSAATTSSLISSSPSSALSKVISSVTTIGKLGEENETTIEASMSSFLDVSGGEPPDQEVALASFITEYKSCIQQLRQSSSSESFSSQSDYVFEGQQGGEMTESEQSIKGTAPAASPWSIVQSFQSVLQYQHPYDKTFLSSNTCQQIVNGLANVLKSVNSIKWMVINRNNNNSTPTPNKQTTVNDSGDDIRLDDDERRNNVYLLQLILLQLWIRMILWNHAQDVGWEIIQRSIALTADDDVAINKDDNKKRKKRRKIIAVSSASGKEDLIDDIKLLTELVPYVIPVSTNLSQWLKYTLTFGFRQRIPEYGAIIFDHFEIELVDEPSSYVLLNPTTTTNDIPAVPDKDHERHCNLLYACTSTNSESPTKQLLAKRHNRQRAYFASLVKEEEEGKALSLNSNATNDNNVTNTIELQSTTTKPSTVTKLSTSIQDEPNIDKLLFKTSVSLTAKASSARTSNPFLKGSARGNYVGSHLGSKLSNITTLFREVKAAPPHAKKLIPMKTQVTEKKIIDVKKKTLRPLGTIASMTTAAVVLRKRKVDDTTLSPTLTPMKTIRSRHSRGVLPMSTIAETPSQHHQSVIDETPAKSQISTRTIRHYRDAIVTETPVPQHDQLQLLRHSIQLQMESPIVAETPLHRLSTRGGGGGGGGGDESRSKQGFHDRISSTVLPTNLWRSNNPSNQQQKEKKRLLPSKKLGTSTATTTTTATTTNVYHLSPMRDQGRRTISSSNDVAQSSSLTNYITSPIVQQQQQLRLFGLSPLSSNDNNSNVSRTRRGGS